MPIRDDSAGGYGTWSSDDLSLIDWLKANASDGGNALANLGRNLVQGFSPIGTSEQGNMALQVPPIAQGFADSVGRLVGTPNDPGNAWNLSGVEELDAPILADGSNVLLSLTGGQAVGGIGRAMRGAPIAQALSDTGKPSILGSAMAGAGEPRGAAVRMSEADRAYHDKFKALETTARPQAPSGSMRVYSGTMAEPFDRFSVGPWMTENPDIASTYAGSHMADSYDKMGHVYPLDISPQNPFYVLPGEGASETIKRLGLDPKIFDGTVGEAAASRGHDFAVYDVPAGKDGYWAHKQYQALKPNTVRSATTGETLFSDNLPSLLGSALATAGENYDLPEWLRF